MTTPAEAEKTRPRPVVLAILDGWGYRPERTDNAIALAATPHLDRWMKSAPATLIEASESHVGLPEGQMGNSEVGHMNIGAGRVILQDLPRIDQAIATGEIFRSPELARLIAAVKAGSGVLHILGLLSPGGVHAHQDHIAALAEHAADQGLRVFIHGFLDGRDTPPSSAQGFLEAFLTRIAARPRIRLATLGGRYFAMDRDRRWDRVERAYRAFLGKAEYRAVDGPEAIRAAYARGETDEFVVPTAIGDFAGMADGDGLFMANFRADRARQILSALLDPDFSAFARDRTPRFSASLGMVEYSAELARRMPCLFPPLTIADSLGEIVAKAGLRQLRIAETEKYAHVTFFFNGGVEETWPGETRILVESPRVATYDLQPEMSAIEVTDNLVAAIAENGFDLIIVNYANGDMVGHTGNLAAAMRAVATIDACLGRLAAAIEKAGGLLLITADHGNAETMRDAASGEAHTAHTLNPVPFLIVGAPDWVAGLAKGGALADIAPTILEFLGLPQPAVMTGRSLIRRKAPSAQRISA